MADEKFNRKNPAVKRILQEVKEMQSNPSDDFMSLPLEDNIFEWQFAIRGPRDTEFEGGIYHGRIQLPAEYPFKPPSFMLLTPNGRFETNTKICLSISNYHPEHWQPSWSVRTALVALIAFMPTSPNGALGSLDYPKEDRRLLAIKSREASPKYGSDERQKLIDEIHEYMLSKADVVPPKPNHVEGHEALSVDSDAQSETKSRDAPSSSEGGQITEEEEAAEVVGINGGPSIAHVAVAEASERGQPRQQMVQRPADERMFTWAAVGLTIAIAVLLLKKFIRSSGYGAVFMDES
ncbi:PREDICTED: ubiquitin-conjugating enzyme E2 32 [Tarenaya hassleriana]|uniref:ubiquitin-conjugating enzyme E2 32 n=1 Tax=Tarenaya hassleriana TaxID=28532 RepID=UPI00053C3E2A|nr:PREDICTED: ubiquitin-conjugating enzyme E2 32 [Tarenaya hassleriana]